MKNKFRCLANVKYCINSAKLIFVFYYLIFIVSTPILAQSPSITSSQPSVNKLKSTRSYITLSNSTTLVKTTINTNNQLPISNNSIIVKDYLSSTRMIIGNNGKIINNISYFPYGSITNSTNSTNITDKLFTGHRQLDDNLSVIHAGARFYSPDLGLFIQPDTVQGPNRYAYAANNPIFYNDLSGNDICDQDPTLAPLWRILGQCGGSQAKPNGNFMNEEGLSSLGQLTAGLEGASIIGGLATWLGDKFQGSNSGTETINSAYASLSTGALVGIVAAGSISPDPIDIGRSTRFITEGGRIANRGLLVSNGRRRLRPSNNSLSNTLFSGWQQITNGLYQGPTRVTFDLERDWTLLYFLRNLKESAPPDISRASPRDKMTYITYYIIDKIEYDVAGEQSMMRGKSSLPLDHFTWPCNLKGVCFEQALLTHLGGAVFDVNSVVHLAKLNILRGQPIRGHAWVSFIDSQYAGRFFADPAYLRGVEHANQAISRWRGISDERTLQIVQPY